MFSHIIHLPNNGALASYEVPGAGGTLDVGWFYGAWKEWNHEPIQALVTFVSFRFSEVFKLSACFRTMACFSLVNTWTVSPEICKVGHGQTTLTYFEHSMYAQPSLQRSCTRHLEVWISDPHFLWRHFFDFKLLGSWFWPCFRGQGLQICYVCHLDHLGHLDHRDHLGHLDHLLQELPWWKEADGRWIRSGIIRLPIFLGVSNKQQIYGKFEKAPFFFRLFFVWVF